jgi:trehalose 6-phosphate phosphatase
MIWSAQMLPSIDELDRYCIFLDFDGTLVELQDSPDDVRVDAATLQFLERLRDKAGRALALVSGRDIHVIDRLLHPLVLPVAGVHGLQRRDAAGYLHTPSIDPCMMEAIATKMEAAFRDEPGIFIERKTGAVALHYRLRPDFEKRCQALAEQVVRNRPELQLMAGKMVCEIRLQGFNKGAVIEAFLNERPFKGRKPIFAGDDVTDEAGFAAVNACDGISIKIGSGPTTAKYRASGIVELRDWFEELETTRRMASAQ